MRLLVSLLTIVIILTPAAAKKAPKETWQRWRGPLRTGESPGVSFPDKLEPLEQIWRVSLDKGYSGPVVAEDRVFTVETANLDTEVIRALDRATGKELWRAEWKGRISVPFYAKKSGDWVRSTPLFQRQPRCVTRIIEAWVQRGAMPFMPGVVE